jgi:CheY-like chemotaxis protein
VNLLSYLFDKSYLNPETIDQVPKINKFSGETQILVAEDDPINLLLITEVLGKMGFDIITAGDGEEALSMLNNHHPALIFMDINMPVMDGYQATELIRQLPNGMSQIPIIALTADAMKEDKEKCLEIGMNDFISKPFRLVEIESVLKKYLKKGACLRQVPIRLYPITHKTSITGNERYRLFFCHVTGNRHQCVITGQWHVPKSNGSVCHWHF